jgi:hypothetical protein
MVNYQNGKIYRIVCNQTGLQYIGSTCMPLSTRLYQHKRLFKDGKSGTSKFVLENNDCNIVLLEDYPTDRKELLLQRERFYIETMECVNKKIPTRTKQEWYEDNKDILADKYQMNREKRIEYQKAWNAQNKDKLREYQKTFKNKHKGIFVDLTEVDVDDDVHIQLHIEDIYDCNETLGDFGEFMDKEDLIDLIDKNINNKL